MRTRVLLPVFIILLFLNSAVILHLPQVGVQSETSGRSSVVRIEVSPSPPLSIDADSQVQFSATMYDSNDEEVLGSPNWWVSSGSIDAGGLFSPSTAGLVNITVTRDSANTTFNFTVVPGWPDSLEVSSEADEVSMGNSLQINATLKDVKGNIIHDKVVSWIAEEGAITEDGLWTPDRTGTFNITAHWNEMHSIIALTATAGPPDKLLFDDGLQVKSGNTISLDPRLEDGWGNELPLEDAGSLSWQVEDGQVLPGWSYQGDAPGIWNITVNSSSGASGTTQVEVLPASLDSFVLTADNYQVMAGVDIRLQLMRTDIFGHVTESLPSLMNWSAEDGSLQVVDSKVIWTPNQVGNWTITVEDEGEISSREFEVLHGVATAIVLATDNDRISADEQAVIWMQATDSQNNRWLVDGSWHVVEDEAEGWLEDHSSWARFEGVKVGDWVIEGQWFDVENQNLLVTELTIEVYEGEVATIQLAGEGQVMSTDESLDLSPRYFDADGNEISLALTNWTLIREEVEEDRTVELRLSRGVFHPSETGSHEIRARTGSAHSSVRFHVSHGEARELMVDVADSTQVVSGSTGTLTLTASGKDMRGAVFAIEDLTWEMDERAGSFSPHPQGMGQWIFEGHAVGTWIVLLSSGHATLEISIDVIPGPVHRLEAELSAIMVEQGSELLLDVKAYDEHNNSVLLNPEDTSVHSTAGEVESLGGGIWRIDTDEGGVNHGVTIRHGELTQQRFFDVNEAILGGIFGSSNGTLVIGSGLLVVILIVLLVIRIRIRGDGSELLESAAEVMKDYNYATEQQPQVLDSQSYQEVGYVQPHVYQAVASPSLQQSQAVAPVVQHQAPSTALSPQQAAEKARQTGVMVAAEGTQQGKTGWYYDSDGALTAWNVDAAGNWTRLK